MQDYRKIDALAKDTERARRLAQFLLKLQDTAWTEWELDFLEDMAGRNEPLSTRQAEKLVELEEAAIWLDTVPGLGFSVRLLVRNCYQARNDLEDDEDIAFIVRLHAEGTMKLRRRALGRLLRCARALEQIEPYASDVLSRSPSAVA